MFVDMRFARLRIDVESQIHRNFLSWKLSRQQLANRLPGCVEGFGQLVGLFAAGLGHVGLAAAAAADDFGGCIDPLAGTQAAVDQIAGQTRPRSSLCRRRGWPSRMAAGLTLRRTRSISSPHAAGFDAGCFGDDDGGASRFWSASSISFSAVTPPALGPAASCFFRSRDFFAERGHAMRHFGGRHPQRRGCFGKRR